jgi:hypothetical protein
MPELPKYRSHKEVQALKIKAIATNGDGSLTILPEDEGYLNFIVPAKFVPKHRDGVPEVGWYWVRYDNDYESFSPAKAFEEGYTRI